MWPHKITLLKDHATLWMGVPQGALFVTFFEGVSDGKLPPYQVWWQQTLW